MRRGGQYYIAADIIEFLQEELERGLTVSQALRLRFDLPEPEKSIINKPRRAKHRSYDVTQLAIGESKSFDLTMFNIYALKRSVQKYSNESGKKFISHVVGTCATVTRTL